MALYVGEAVKIRARALDPDTGNPLDPPPSGARIAFWGPGKNPVRDLDDRANPNHPDTAMNPGLLADNSAFVHFQATAGWDAGKWTYRVTVEGENYENWEYGTFTLRP